MLTLTYCYRIYPNAQQENQMLEWLETCRRTYNYAVRERKDWINSRKCDVSACSLQSEYIIPADTPYPDYYKQKKALTEAKKSNLQMKAVSQVIVKRGLIAVGQTVEHNACGGQGTGAVMPSYHPLKQELLGAIQGSPRCTA